MATKRKRDSKGRFLKGRATSRRKPTRRKAVARRRTSAPRRQVTRRAYRRNPARPDVVKMLTRGTLTATQVLVGKAATRAVPDLMNLPKAGNAGLAVQVATALALGYVSEMFFSKTTAAAILAGGLTAPVETLIQAANIPYLSGYLSPGADAAAIQGYVQSPGLAGYVPPVPGSSGLAGGRGGYAGDATGEHYPPAWQ